MRLVVAVLALVALVALIALPVLAADPSGAPSPSASEPVDSSETAASPSPATSTTEAPTATSDPTAAPEATAASTSEAPDADGDGTQMPERPPKPAKDKAAKTPGEPVTLTGTVGSRTDADGRTAYTLTTGASVVVLDAGPSWFYGDDHPLADHVGEVVTVAGTQRAGADEVDVETVDGHAIREPGKPPWAGGPKVVGERHPGWSEEKAARWEAKRAEQAARHGTTCWPPGHCKDAAAGGAPGPTNPPGD
jgi:hypothetical protein